MRFPRRQPQEPRLCRWTQARRTIFYSKSWSSEPKPAPPENQSDILSSSLLAALWHSITKHSMSEDINQAILAELRKLKRVSCALLVFLILGTLPSFYSAFKRDYSRADSWDRVTTMVRRQDFPAALSMAQSLVACQPDYYYGHAYLGAIYLAMGDVTNAETQYTRAYELFPSEEVEKDLAAIRKRLAAPHDLKPTSK